MYVFADDMVILGKSPQDLQNSMTFYKVIVKNGA